MDPRDSPFVRTCLGETAPHTPVWFMRQAGRALPEYRAARAGVGMLESCLRPELVTEITLQPVRRYRVDAAILFSDIVLPLRAAGVDLDIVPGTGPVVAQPVRDRAGVAALPELDPDRVAGVAQAVAALRAELGGTPLIGFAGAPFTLASYLVEGGPSRGHERTRALMASEPELWEVLCRRLAGISRTFLQVQVRAGVSAVQLFDSWAGVLAEADYRAAVLRHSAAVLADLGVPRIHFGVGTGELLGAMSEAGAEVVGVDWRVPLDRAATRAAGRVLQGNLDPAVVLAPWPVLADRARGVLRQARGLPGHVFNLGHGVLPQTDPDQLTRLVELVHAETAVG